MLLDMLVWVSPEADLKIRNQVKVVYLGVEGQPEGMQGSETKGKEPQRVCDQADEGCGQLEHNPLGKLWEPV